MTALIVECRRLSPNLSEFHSEFVPTPELQTVKREPSSNRVLDKVRPPTIGLGPRSFLLCPSAFMRRLSLPFFCPQFSIPERRSPWRSPASVPCLAASDLPPRHWPRWDLMKYLTNERLQCTCFSSRPQYELMNRSRGFCHFSGGTEYGVLRKTTTGQRARIRCSVLDQPRLIAPPPPPPLRKRGFEEAGVPTGVHTSRTTKQKPVDAITNGLPNIASATLRLPGRYLDPAQLAIVDAPRCQEQETVIHMRCNGAKYNHHHHHHHRRGGQSTRGWR